MFLYKDMEIPTDYKEEEGPIAGGNYGGVDFGRQLGDIPEWLALNEESDFLTPGAIKEGEEDPVQFLRDTPRDAFTDEATQRVIEFDPNMNPTKLVDREYLLSDRSELIRDAATILQNTMRSLQPVVYSRQPVLERMVVSEVRSDGHLEEGEVIWGIEISAANQPGIHWTRQSTPVRKMRVSIPMKVTGGVLEEPKVFLLASNRPYPLTITGCQLALNWRAKPVSVKKPPKVERSWQEERDYRAF